LKHRLAHLGAELDRIKKDGLYHRLRPGSVSGPYITVNGRKLLNLCSNDYLGMPGTPTALAQMQSSSRLIAGNDDAYCRLEEALARHKSQQDALVFPTGYMANLGVIASIAKRGDTILGDELNHASIIDACRLSGARVSVYRHNDTADLGRKIRHGRGRRLIVTEGVFSMDGDLARLDEIVELAQAHDAVTVLDDAHGDFATGRDGRGTASRFRVAKKIDVYISSLSKALGSFGGYAASQRVVTDYCINRSRPLIYTSALPGSLIRHALGRMRSGREPYRKRLERNTEVIAGGLTDAGFQTSSQSHIIPIVIGDEGRAMDFGRYLMSQGVFAQPVRYPTVAKGSARIRISVTARLADSHLQRVLDVFERAGKKFKII